MANDIVALYRSFSEEVDRLVFSDPVTHVYNPLSYASQSWENYVTKYGRGAKRVLFVGMNPGPWGMSQTGVPFGDVGLVSSWLGIDNPVGKPKSEHRKRSVEGFSCTRSEVSGRRLWSLMKERFGTADQFFADHFVGNYCPLAFLEESGRNRTPDKLKAGERSELFSICNRYLGLLLSALKPEWAIGVGKFAYARLCQVSDESIKTEVILHPSPANPRANRDWSGQVIRHLENIGVWPSGEDQG